MPEIQQAAIKLDISKLNSKNNEITELKKIDPRYVRKDSTEATHEYQEGANSINYAQFGDEFKEEAIKGINGDLNRNINSKIVVNGEVLDLRKEVEKFVSKEKPELLSGKFNYETVKSYLVEKHKLSDHQANFILAASMQGSLAGGAQAVLKDIDGRQDFSPVVQRGPGFVLEITENKCSMLKSKNIHFVSGDDVTKEFNESNVNNFLGDNANLCNTSDNIIVNACIDLGKPGAKTEPITTLELAARGECCDIIDEIIEIQQKEYAKVEPEKIKKDLDKFEEIIRGKGECEKAKQNISEDLKKYQKNPDQCKTIVEFKLIDVKFSTLNKLQDAQDLTANKSRQALAVDLAKDLKDYYPDYRKGYLERFSKNIVNDFAKNAKNIEIKKGFFSSLVSRFKDKVNGYKKNEEPENIKMIQGYLKNATSIILPKEPLNPNSKNNNISQEKTQGANLQAENISNKIRRNLEHLISKTRSSSITNKTSPDIVSTSSEFKKRSSSMNQK